MHSLLSILLMTPPASGASGGAAGGGMMSTVIMFVMIGAIFYLMIYRPQKKRQKERESLLGTMEKGDKVITSSGIHGTISQIDDATILVQVSDNTKLRFEKASVTTVVTKKDA